MKFEHVPAKKYCTHISMVWHIRYSLEFGNGNWKLYTYAFLFGQSFEVIEVKFNTDWLWIPDNENTRYCDEYPELE